VCGSVCREEERLTVAAWSVERGAWSMEHGASPSAGHHHHLPHAKEAGGQLQYRQAGLAEEGLRDRVLHSG
jgi:hypothetical protein